MRPRFRRIRGTGKRHRKASGQQLSATVVDWALTHDRILYFCERSDRVIRAVLGNTPEQTALRFTPVLIRLLIAAAAVSLAR